MTKPATLMGPTLRRAALVAHVSTSLGWLGSVVAFLVLVVVGLRSTDLPMVRACYVAADLVTRFAIVPLCFAALATGLIQSLGTAWGLFRNYWVIAKLLLTLAGTGLLLLHTGPIGHLATAASDSGFAPTEHRALQRQLVADAAAAILLLLLTTGLSVYKPRGVTPYGWRKQREEQGTVQENPMA
jgi:hypothetical protein